MKLRVKLSKCICPILIGICAMTPNIWGQSVDYSSLGQSGAGMIHGSGAQGAKTIPTPNQLFSMPMQYLFGFPEQVMFGVLNKACSLLLASNIKNVFITPKAEKMYYQLRTPCKSINVPLQQPEELVNLPEFDVDKKVIMFLSGWATKGNESHIQELANAYNCRGDYNFVYLNVADTIETLYIWSSYNTAEIGNLVADSLRKFTETVPVENIHLIGLSFGAHVVGAVGRKYKELTGQSLPRITGLDPANPCFNKGQAVSSLSRDDAAFVDIIHTNPGALGKADSLGHVDFYVGGKGAIQPGCLQFSCSHLRSVDYYIESVYPGNEGNFMAKRCDSMQSFNGGLCDGPDHPMGYSTPLDAEGDHYLNVNLQRPYGINAPANAMDHSSHCGLCSS
uniref:Lipase domain-containing protein n=1 Tax=Musca domestica TaxID=7370 RepID=A0A1I8M3T9_MUSDO